MTNPIICIPRMDANISKDKIFNVFSTLKIGKIIKITENSSYKTPEYKRVAISIQWNQTPSADYIINRLQTKQSVNVIYSAPWFWKCTEYSV